MLVSTGKSLGKHCFSLNISTVHSSHIVILPQNFPMCHIVDKFSYNYPLGRLSSTILQTKIQKLWLPHL